MHFWATSCGVCKEKMPQLKTLKEKYKNKGLRFVAVHMPRYEADTDIEQVKAAVSKYEIDELMAIDNQHKIKDAFQNEQDWVPVYFLFDAEGKLKSRAAGEFGIGIITGVLEKMFPAQSATA